MAERYAFFDLDHTLLPYDTQSLFCNFVLKREGWRRVYLLWFLPALPLAALRILDLATMKRLFLGFLWGMPGDRLARYAAEFASTDFADAVYPELVAEIERHRAEGRVLVLNSASPDFYLGEIAGRLGFDRVFGTRVRVEERMPFLPRLEGPNNKREAKIRAMEEAGLIPPGSPVLADAWAYSDSAADLPLLRLAEHGVMIHPGRRLAAAGLAEGWRALTPRRPYCCAWAGRWAAVRQALGLHPPRKPVPENPPAGAGGGGEDGAPGGPEKP